MFISHNDIALCVCVCVFGYSAIRMFEFLNVRGHLHLWPCNWMKFDLLFCGSNLIWLAPINRHRPSIQLAHRNHTQTDTQIHDWVYTSCKIEWHFRATNVIDAASCLLLLLLRIDTLPSSVFVCVYVFDIKCRQQQQQLSLSLRFNLDSDLIGCGQRAFALKIAPK